jgi:uncharacterized oxidoreductase
MLEREVDVGTGETRHAPLKITALLLDGAAKSFLETLESAEGESVEQRLLVREVAARRRVADAELAAELAQGNALGAAGLQRLLRHLKQCFVEIAMMVGTGRCLHGQDLIERRGKLQYVSIDNIVSTGYIDRTNMNITDNTLFITGGGSGIGRGLAEAFHALGNRVIIAGRRQDVLDQTADANPGMGTVSIDMSDPASIQQVAAELIAHHPKLNVLINNAGISRLEDLATQTEPSRADAMITTNLLGPIRLTTALLPHLLKQPRATIINVTSGLGFVPLPIAPTYSATKAALHSYTQSLRYQLKDTSVEVIEIIPPYVQTELGGQAQTVDPRAMPLKDYIEETMENFKKGMPNGENCVEKVKFLRDAEATGNYEKAFAMLGQMVIDPSHP